MEEGVSLREMLPFLNRYLGHQSTDDTFYYYHQISEAFQIIRDRDKTSGFVIPEVTGHDAPLFSLSYGADYALLTCSR